MAQVPKLTAQTSGHSSAAVSCGQRWLRKRAAFGGRRAKPGRLSYREISARLKDAGYVNERGESFKPQSVRAMIEWTTAAAAPSSRQPVISHVR